MTIVHVNPGPCGLQARIEVTTTARYQTAVKIESDCQAVMALAQELTELGMNDVLGREGFGKSRPFVLAAKTLKHATCPVLSGVLKAAEAEMGLALPRDVTIIFEPKEQA